MNPTPPERTTPASAPMANPSLSERGGTPHSTPRVEPYLFIFPAFVGIVLLTGGAIVASAGLSLTEWDLVSSPHFIGFQNFVELWDSQLFWKVFGNTLLYAALAVPLSVVGSLLLALLVNARLPGIAFFRTAYFVPVVCSMVAVALVWGWLYNPEFGLTNYLIRELADVKGPRWLLSTDWALPSIVVMSVWKGLGYNMLILLAGLQSVPRELQEAAIIDGAGPVRRFFSVTLPVLSPTLFFVVVITTIGALQIFEQTYVLTQGGPANSTLTLSYYVYQTAFQFFRMGSATAMAYVLFAVTLVVTIAQFRMQKRWVYYG